MRDPFRGVFKRVQCFNGRGHVQIVRVVKYNQQKPCETAEMTLN